MTMLNTDSTVLPRLVPRTLCLQVMFGDFVGQACWLWFGLIFSILITLGFEGRTPIAWRSGDFSFDGTVLLLLLLSSISLSGIVLLISKGLNAIRLMRDGTPVQGTFVSGKITHFVRPEDDPVHTPVYRLQFRYSADDGRHYLVKCTSTFVKPAWELTILESSPSAKQFSFFNGKQALSDRIAELRMIPRQPDEWEQTIYYLPTHPFVAAAMLDFSPSFDMDAQGVIHDTHPALGILSIIIPALALIAISICALVNLCVNPKFQSLVYRLIS